MTTLKMNLSPQRSRCMSERKWCKTMRLWIVAIVMPLTCSVLGHSNNANAGFPEVVERGGRFCGYGYGDGYHACHSSGMRPLANLPPRTYAARVGTLAEKIVGCPTCRPRPLPGVDPIRARRPETFYHRFDRYAQQVSHREMQQNANRPVQRLVDPEQEIARSYSQHDPQPNMREYDRSRIQTYRSPYANHGKSTLINPETTADGEPVAPPISEKEMEEFREYQEAKRLRNKFDKYLIEPDEIEPNQVIGGPPVGTQQRRMIDERKVKALKEKIRRELAEDARQSQSMIEDDLMSPSDSMAPSKIDSDDETMPLNELLPPFPGDDSLLEQELTPETDLNPSGSDQTLKDSLKSKLEELRSPETLPLRQTQTEFNAPLQVGSQAVPGPPELRVAELPPSNKAPESWRFIKQPR